MTPDDAIAADARSAMSEAFPRTSPHTIRGLFGAAEFVRVAAGQTIVPQGAATASVLLVNGYAGQRRTTFDGRQVIVRIMARSALVVFAPPTGSSTVADVIALTACDIATWPAGRIRAFAAVEGPFALDVLDQALKAYHEVIERTDGLMHQDAVTRVTRALYRYRDLFFADEPVLTRAHLPLIVGTSREMTGRVLRTLEARGIISRREAHGLVLLDPAGLEKLGGPSLDVSTEALPGPGADDESSVDPLEHLDLLPGSHWADFAPSAVLEASPNPIVAVDAFARITYANPQAVATFGYEREELLGHAVEMLLPERVAERHLDHRDGFIANPVARPMGIGLDLAGRRKDGSEFPVEISLAPVETSDGIQVFATVVDITARKAAENQLLQAQKLESIGRLAGGIAHDFNNMLFAISGYAEMLEEDLARPPDIPIDRDAALRSVAAIGHAADRAASLTMQLLAFSRQQVVSPKVLDIGNAIRAIEPMLRPIIGETIKLVLHSDPEAGHIRADPGQLDQILVNLVVNARDAMPDGGTITIDTGNTVFDDPFAIEHFEVKAGPYVMLAVSDTGQGMDRATREHIFEPFFTTKETGKGTGLGLATIYGIVRQAGGHIWLYSEPGVGTSFKLYFPRDDAPTTIDPAKPRRMAAGTGTLLVVEDEPAVRDMTTAVLERAGYTVIAVADGVEALAKIATLERPIDVLVSDVVMPNMSGLELSETVLDRYPETGLVLLSGYTAEILDPSRLTARGAIFVSKPIGTRELLAAIEQAMPVRTT
jgi:two-component system cell cycle sensor histidine kinase/response regulator CckA